MTSPDFLSARDRHVGAGFVVGRVEKDLVEISLVEPLSAGAAFLKMDSLGSASFAVSVLAH